MPPSTQPTTEYLITDQGVVMRTVTNSVVAPLSALAGRIPAGFINTAFQFDGMPVHLLHTEKALTYAFQMVKLPFTTFFEPSLAFKDVPLLVPVFSHTENSAQASCIWQVPENCRLFHVTHLKTDKVTGRATSWIGYLVAMPADSSDKTCYRLPLTNVYEDGRICYGSGAFPELTPSNPLMPGQLAVMMHQRLLNSTWNADLLGVGGSGGRNESQRVFQFDPKSLLSLSESANTWKNFSRGISNEVFTNILIHIN
jgi:hypothetical protein